MNFVGACVEFDKVFILTSYCSKGSLQVSRINAKCVRRWSVSIRVTDSYFQSLNSYFESLNSYFESLNSYFESLNSYLKLEFVFSKLEFVFSKLEFVFSSLID